MHDHVNECFIGIDHGTSGCRAMAINAAGDVIASYVQNLPGPEQNTNEREQHPRVWWDTVCDILAGLVKLVPHHIVQGIAVDGTSGTVLLIDDHGNPLGKALMYDDARYQSQAAAIAAIAPDTCGAHGPASALAKLLYLQQQPYASKARHVAHQADWICGQLCGKYGVSDENNCLKLGYDAIQRRWPEWLETLGVHMHLLPKVVTAGTFVGIIDRVIADQLNLPVHTRIIAGTTDGVAGFLATGARTIGDAVTSLGSTLVLKILTEKPVFSPQHGVYSHRLGNRWLAGGASNCGGKTLLQYFTRQQLDLMTPMLQPDNVTGLDYYPLPVQGERFPRNDPAMQPRLTPRPADDVMFFQGILEGIACVEAEGYRLLARLGAPLPHNILSVGGGAYNQAWTRIRASLLKIPVQAALHDQAAYGAALLAFNACLDNRANG